MQLSVTPDHPGYDPEAHLLSIKVKLNGELVRNIIAFDTEAGYVVTLGKVNEFGLNETKTFGHVQLLDFDSDKVLHETPPKE